MVKTRLNKKGDKIITSISNPSKKIFFEMSGALGRKGLNFEFKQDAYEGQRKVWLVPVNNYKYAFNILATKDGRITFPEEVKEAMRKADKLREDEYDKSQVK